MWSRCSWRTAPKNRMRSTDTPGPAARMTSMSSSDLMRSTAISLLPLLAAASGLSGQESAAAAPGFEIRGPAFVALHVEDVERAAAWYSRVFSLSPAKEIDADGGRFRIRILAGANLTVELIEMGAVAAPQRHLGFFKFGLYVDDIDAAFEWFRGAGVDIDDSTFVDEALSVRSFVMRDPSGNRLQVFASCDGAC